MQATESKRQHLSTGPPAAARAPADRDSSGRAGLVSVIIPAYNEAATVESTISSLRNQTYSDLEMQVVGDGSTDETAAADIDDSHADCRSPEDVRAQIRQI